MQTLFIYKPFSCSPTPLDREPTSADRETPTRLGFRYAKPGPGTFERSIACPVNGDGYWYTRRELVDCETGEVVGSVADDDGPRGEL